MTYPTSLRTFATSQQTSEDEEIFYDVLKLGNKRITSRQIQEKIAELRCIGFTSSQIRARMREIYAQFTGDAETIGTKVTAFEKGMSTTLDGYRATDAKIQATELKTTPFFKKRGKSDESTHASFQGFVKDRAWEHVVTARVATEAAKPVAAAVGFVAKESVAVLLGCRGEGKKNCEALRSFIKEKAKDVVTKIGVKPALKRILQAEAEIHRLGQLGIPKEHAQRYVQDERSLLIDAACTVSGGLTVRLVKQLLPSGNILGPLKGAKRESRLLSNEHEHLIGNSKGSVAKVNKKGQRIVEETKHTTYYLAPQSEKISGSNKKFSYPTTQSSLSTRKKSANPLLLGTGAENIATFLPSLSQTSKPLSTKHEGTAKPPKPQAPSLEQNNLFSEAQDHLAPRENLHIPIFITQTATHVSPGEKIIPQSIDVDGVMKEGLFGDSIVKQYFGKDQLSPIQEFIQKNIHQSFTITTVKNPQRGNILHIVRDINRQPIAYVKEFRMTSSIVTGFIPEVVSHTILNAERFKYASFATIQDLGWYMTHGEQRGLVMYLHIPGKTLKEFFVNQLEIPAEEIGQVIGEINSVTSSLTIPEGLIEYRISRISNMAEEVFYYLSLLGESSPFTMKMIKVLSHDLKVNPGRPGLVHGDANPTNLLIDKHRVAVIDTGTLMASVNRVGMPKGMPAFDQQHILVVMHHLGAIHRYDQGKIENIVSKYSTGYCSQLPVAGSEAAERYARLFYEIFYLNQLVTSPYLNQYDRQHLLPLHIERINTVFGQIHVRSRQEKSSQSKKKTESSPLAAERINRVFNPSIEFPVVDKLTNIPLKTLHDIWSKNQETLLGIIAKEEIPKFGLHGTSYLGIKTLLKGTNRISIQGNYIGVIGLPVIRGPLDQLGALYTIVQKAIDYLGKKGGLFIIDTTIASATNKKMFENPELLTLDNPIQRDILEKMGDGLHAEEWHVPFNEKVSSKLIKGLILEEETLYPEGFVKSLLTNDKTADWGILAKRLRMQETLITVFEKLGIIKDFHLFPWETFRKIGEKILTTADSNNAKF